MDHLLFRTITKYVRQRGLRLAMLPGICMVAASSSLAMKIEATISAMMAVIIYRRNIHWPMILHTKVFALIAQPAGDFKI